MDTVDTAIVLRMAPEMTIYGAAELRVRLAAAFAEAGPGGLVLDLADVCDIDSAGVQLLIAARQEAQACGAPLRLQHHSAAVLDAFGLLGLGPDGTTGGTASTGECA